MIGPDRVFPDVGDDSVSVCRWTRVMAGGFSDVAGVSGSVSRWIWVVTRVI